MKYVTSMSSALLSLALAGAAFAQAPAPAATDSTAQATSMVNFGVIDQNKDGRVSKAEAQSNGELKAAFEKLDVDRDGYLSQQEFSKWSKAGKSTEELPSGAGGGSASPDSAHSGQ